MMNLSATAQCTADFFFLNSPGSLTVQFRDTSFAGPGIQLLHNWWFSDGFSSSSLPNPTHTFSAPGTYLVYLSVFDSLNTCFDSTSKYVTVNYPQCTAAYSYQITPAGDSSIVDFTNQSINYSDSAIFTYDFGDGTSFSNQAIFGGLNPTKSYLPGSYIVSLDFIDSLYQTTCSFIDTIDIPVNNRPCIVDFVYSITPVLDSSRVDFINLSVDYDSTSVFNYDFGDGNQLNIPSSGSNIDAQWTYAPGDYLFKLSVIDSITGDSCFKSDSINIPFNSYCDAGFTVSYIGDSVLFRNQAIGYTSIKYFFGDGDSSTLSDPIHVYAQSNSYTVTQMVFDSLSNCTDTATLDIQVTVSNSCVALFVPAIDTSKKQLLYLINQSSDLNTHQYLWDFGDGNTGSGQTPIHTYSDYGAYEICLTVSDPTLNCVSNFCDTIGLDSNNNVIQKSRGFTLQVLDGGAIGIEERSQMDAISVYPNPVSDRLYLNLPHNIKEIEYQLFNIEGQRIHQGKLDHSDPSFDLSKYKDGLYILTLRFQNQLKKLKVLKME